MTDVSGLVGVDIGVLYNDFRARRFNRMAVKPALEISKERNALEENIKITVASRY